MKNRTGRIPKTVLALMLALLMAFSALSCSETAPEEPPAADNPAGQTDPAAENAPDAEPEETALKAELPDKTFGGADLLTLNRLKDSTARNKDFAYAYAILKLYNKIGGKAVLSPYALYEHKH